MLIENLNFSIDEADILMAAVNYILSLTSQLQHKMRWSNNNNNSGPGLNNNHSRDSWAVARPGDMFRSEEFIHCCDIIFYNSPFLSPDYVDNWNVWFILLLYSVYYFESSHKI